MEQNPKMVGRQSRFLPIQDSTTSYHNPVSDSSVHLVMVLSFETGEDT